MTDSPTVQINRCLDRLRGGDGSARDELIRCACERLQSLTRKMLRDFAGVRRWEETSDVFQNAVLRLCRAIREVTPATARDFYRLAAVQVRRELIDLSRHYRGPEGLGANHASHRSGADGLPEPAVDAPDPIQLAAWTEFHQQVESLPDEEREVFDLLWYQGLKQTEAAEVLGVVERTVKRRWQAARLRLFEAMSGQVPEI